MILFRRTKHRRPSSLPPDPGSPSCGPGTAATFNSEKRRRRAHLRRERGVALLMVLGTLTIATVMLTEFQDTVSAELGSSVSARDQVKAEYAARSAVNLTRLLLAAEPTVSSTLKLLTQGAQVPVWEYTDVLLGPFNDTEGGSVFESVSGMRLGDGRNLGMDGASFKLVVVDEDSKINFNLAARADSFSVKRQEEQLISLIGGIQYNQFFEEAEDENGTPLDRQTICSAIVDWVDPNVDKSACDPTNTTASVVTPPEDSYYQLLPRPYSRKNAAFDSLEELHMVQGVSDGFWRRFIEPDPDDPKSRIVTVWGSGKVNVNSANPMTYLALVCQQVDPGTPLCVDPIMQQKFLMTFQMFSGALQGMPLFPSEDDFVKMVKGEHPMLGEMLKSLGIEPVKPRSDDQLKKSITTESKVFSIYATGLVESGKLQTRTNIHAVIDMRGAPPPGTAETLTKLEQLRNLEADAAQIKGLDLPPQLQEGGLAAFLLPKPGGSVLYYRVD